MELERGGNKKRRNDKSVVCGIWKERCYRRKSIRTRKKEDLMSRI